MAADFGLLVGRFNTSTPSISTDNSLREIRIDSGGRLHSRLTDDRDVSIRYFNDEESVDATPSNDKGILILGKNDVNSNYQVLRVNDDGSLVVSTQAGTDNSEHSDGTGGIFSPTDIRGEITLTIGTWVKIHDIPVTSGRVHIDGWSFLADKNTLFQICMSDDTGLDGHDRADVIEILDSQLTTSGKPSDHENFGRALTRNGGTNIAVVIWAKQLQTGNVGIGSGMINSHITT